MKTGDRVLVEWSYGPQGAPSAGVRRQLAEQRKLHLACGTNILAGWANIDQNGGGDVIRWDLTQPLPVEKRSVDFIFNEHFIEHITRDQAGALLSQCREALAPGGVLRVSTPDLRKLCAEYLAGRTDEWRDVNWLPATPCRLLNEGMRLWGHQFVYDGAELRALLAEVGFGTIASRAWRQSPHRALCDLECRPFHGELIFEASE